MNDPVDIRRDIIEDHDGMWAGENWIFHRKIRKARKRHECHACDEAIEKGTHYVEYVTAGLEGPGMETWRVHGECFIENLSMMVGEKRPAWRWEKAQAEKHKPFSELFGELMGTIGKLGTKRGNEP